MSPQRKAKAPVERKVKVATAASGATGAAVVLLVNLINREPLDQTALAVVLGGLVTAVVTFAGSYMARHTTRAE